MKGNSSGVDIPDRHKELFKPGVPTRTEDTFCEGAATGFPAEGCFTANISGPVRAIRSYMGANSGFITQREHIFYEDREDINTYLKFLNIKRLLSFGKCICRQGFIRGAAAAFFLLIADFLADAKAYALLRSLFFRSFNIFFF